MNFKDLLEARGFTKRGHVYYSKDSKFSWTSYENDPDIYWNLHIVKNGYSDDMVFKIEDEQTLDVILKAVKYEP